MYLYVFTNKINGMEYVGQSLTDPGLNGGRIQSHFSGSGNHILGKDIVSYGKDAFSVQVYHFPNWTTQAELDAGEKAFIAARDCIEPNGYNLTDGGKKEYTVSDGTRQLMKKSGKKRDYNPISSVWNFAPDIVIQYTIYEVPLHLIAKAYSVSTATISKILKSQGAKLRSASEAKQVSDKKGKKRHPVWQSASDVIKLHDENKISKRQLAKRYRCSRTLISSILVSKTDFIVFHEQ